ncbi:MAG: site-specific DNA-methyltransferase [Spirochaetes bacterium]|nr:site-specific DNA-methyltransferase [Spirochaetota bacterium]
MDKLKMHSPDLTKQNIEKLAELFPNCVTEIEDASATGDKKTYKKVIDFDQLKQELSDKIVEGPQERYHLNWPGKREALITANLPIAKTLRPCREESVDFETTQNLFIEGDNLDALKLLQETYLGKIKMIYIDPPYNTGNDILYKNNYFSEEDDYLFLSGQKNEEGFITIANTESNGKFHSNWLSMIFPRLKLARNLLTNDGILFITIDHNELNTLISICDEIFGHDNRIGIIAIRNNPAGRSTLKGLSITHEYAILYGKSEESKICRFSRNEKQIARYNEKDEKGHFEWVNFRKPGSQKNESPKMYYPIFVSPYSIRIPNMTWDAQKNEWILMENNNKNEQIVYPIDEDGKLRRWRWAIERAKEEIPELQPKLLKNNWHVYLKARIPNDGVLPNTWWDKKEYSSTAYGTNLMKNIFSELQIFTYPKSIYAVMDSIKAVCENKNDIILDFFAGSSTTAHAIIQINSEEMINRKFIMVQYPAICDEKSEAFKAGYKTIAEISKERIRRAGKKIKEELEQKKKEQESQLPLEEQKSFELDTGFRVLKVDDSNMEDIYYTPDSLDQSKISLFTDNIKHDRTEEDLLFQVLLDWGVDLTLPITKEKVANKEVFFVDQNALAACFDKEAGITEEFCKELAKRKPLRAVFRDAGFKDDSVKINVEQIFKLMSPGTEVKCI